MPRVVAAHQWKKLLPFLPDQVGGIWNRDAQIDVAGVNFMDKTLILGECKWDPHAKDASVLANLVEKTDKVLPTDGKWKVFYLVFARSGWTENAIAFAKGMKAGKAQGERWGSAGMLLRTLAQVDEELRFWTDG